MLPNKQSQQRPQNESAKYNFQNQYVTTPKMNHSEHNLKAHYT